MSGIFDKTTDALSTSLDMRLLRQNITSGNIANAETPGYHAKKIDFEDALQRAIEVEGGIKQSPGADPDDFAIGGGGSIKRTRADVYDNPEINLSNDKNTVDMEREMATLAENTILYRAALQLINKKLASLKYAATDGGR